MPKAVRAILCLAGLLAMLTISSAAPAADPPKGGEQPQVMVSGQASLDRAPDRVELTLGVNTLAPSAQEAAARNAEAMQKVLAEVKKRLGPQDKVQTVSYRINLVRDYDPKEREQKIRGFEAVNLVRIESSDIAGVGRLLDAAAAAGSNQIQGPNWTLDNPAAARMEAQIKALADARAQALALAREAGMELGPVVWVDATGGVSPGPMPRLMRAEANGASAPMEPGQVEVSASVTARYLLIPRP